MLHCQFYFIQTSFEIPPCFGDVEYLAAAVKMDIGETSIFTSYLVLWHCGIAQNA